MLMVTGFEENQPCHLKYSMFNIFTNHQSQKCGCTSLLCFVELF